MELIESKSLLAKLMATENLTIEQRNVRTAAFDVKNRVLIVPILDKNISSEVYDLFMGHEVGHALYTPESGLIRAKDLNINLSIANIVEDSRIERKIKYKYPGLKRSFLKAYKELLDGDFFGTKNVNLNKMNFLDRLNLHCKGGANLHIVFSEKEKQILDMVENTETYDDVIDVSKKIMDFLEEESKKQTKKETEESEITDEDFLFEDFSDDEDFHEGMKQSPENYQEGDSNKENDKQTESFDDKNSDETGTGSDESSEKNKNDFRSFTEEAFSQNQIKLFDEKSKGFSYMNIPDFDLKSIYDHKSLWKAYRKEDYKIDRSEYRKIRNEGNKVVSYLVKEFEMRKNAEQLKRASTSKTGDLDINKIFSYKFNEDIFKKVSVVPGGKSHGLVIFLDWSGSMVEHMKNTTKQLINLAFFCKKVNIPFEVYCFKDNCAESLRVNFLYKSGDLYCDNFELFNLLSSRMTAAEFTYACAALIHMSNGRTSYRNKPEWMEMHGTPLNQAIVCSMKIVPEFQKKNKLQVVNTIFLTDGEGQSLSTKYGVGREPCEFVVLRDPVTKHQEQIHAKDFYSKQTDSLIRLLRKRTNSNVVGFYVINGRDFNRKTRSWFRNQDNHDEIKDEFRKNKFMVLENTGYNEYYILHSGGLDTEEDSEMKVPTNFTTRNLVSAFTKYAGARVANRVVLNRFINLIT